ncbi:DUF2272 domain-containing protein [Lysobacter pythonis]|uniref:DUF2272 domain-containing protein n=1 Tax=Solilutibacter pythonis TaxID=2483112 RepID=A0A3M2HG03_9GAMM|nr:DUF2272 domain-containing protein [Lysobacter pythonis]RMH88671.1 DUF2272 domain-containing protein [Lysobacter pythonis]
MEKPITRLPALIVAGALLAGCASSPKAPPTPPASPPAPSMANTTAQPAVDPAIPNRPIWRAPPMAFPPGTPAASRIVQITLREHLAWYQPFIDVNGRLASRRVAEAERAKLNDGSEAWERVVAYWRDSGTLYRMLGSSTAAYQCQNPFSSGFARNECRAFLVDVPWSAAFISYVMTQAGVAGFTPSPSHIDYIRAAYRGQGPYAFADPNQTKIAPGDMLCYVRNSQSVIGHGGLTTFLAAGNGGLQSHCDIAVSLTPNEVWLVGGNVANMVTMRKLRLDGQGRALLPRPISDDWVMADEDGQSPACSPANEAACSMNRQNWAALLKLTAP